MTNRLETTLSGIKFKNPVIPASGTFGFGYEMAKFYDLDILGGIAIKGTTLSSRFGNDLPRIAECEAGMLNAIGLQNPGVEAVVAEELPKLREVFSGPVLANISGFSKAEYVAVAKRFDETDVDILEINISCPNVKCGGMAFGTSPEAAAGITGSVKSAVKKPVFIKLTPNVTDIAAIAKACEDAGADGLTLINTLLGMRIDPLSGRPIVSTGTAGLSGPAIKPVALRMVYSAALSVKIPIIGVGGLSSADDVIEMLSAGATAVQIGSANLINPFACRELIEELPVKMDEYGIASINECIGRSLE
ncbi:MAG: dihydroorotate dehydrogenase [Oscillospiraceae bacterium]|nr:dihydroorotate dehydrogenase [Oscillospiraceae bacterium]